MEYRIVFMWSSMYFSHSIYYWLKEYGKPNRYLRNGFMLCSVWLLEGMEG